MSLATLTTDIRFLVVVGTAILFALGLTKRYRDTHPKLEAFTQFPLRMPGENGEHFVILKNVSEIPTTLGSGGYMPVVPKDWCPRWVLSLLSTWVHRIPLKSSGCWSSFTDANRNLPAHGSVQFKVILWPIHVEALMKGRLVVSLEHHYSHGKKQQVFVRMMM